MEDNADRRLRRLRPQVDSGESEPAQLPVKEMSLNVVGQRRHRRQDTGSADQGWAQPQDEGKEAMTTGK